MQLLTLETDAGRLDVMTRPEGAPRYEVLRKRAKRERIAEGSVLVASIGDLLAMKRASGRPEDLADAAELEAIERLRRDGAQ